MKQKKTIYRIILHCLIAIYISIVCCSCGIFGKTYRLEETSQTGITFQGEFTLNFSDGTFRYSGHDIEMLCNYGIMGVAVKNTIEKSGRLYDCNESRNGKSKYRPSGMDYYIWVSEDKNSISYGGYTFYA